MIFAEDDSRPPISLKTIHISCASHNYQDGHNYAGFILYSYDNKTEWCVNSRHCKTGYLVIQDTDSDGVNLSDISAATLLE